MSNLAAVGAAIAACDVPAFDAALDGTISAFNRMIADAAKADAVDRFRTALDDAIALVGDFDRYIRLFGDEDLPNAYADGFWKAAAIIEGGAA